MRTRALRFHRCAYLSVDGVHGSVQHGEDPKLGLLVVIGVRVDGEKELLAVEDGYASQRTLGGRCSAISATGAERAEIMRAVRASVER